MHHRLTLFLATTVLLVVMTNHVTSLDAEEKADGYTMLFNGKDLTGWKTRGDWSVEEGGVLALDPRPGKRGMLSYRLFLWTKKKYGDFILDLEFKLAPGGDTSVFVRSKSLLSYFEVEVADSHGKKEPLTDDDCGAVVKVAPPTKNMARPAGQWNRLIITCKGSHLKVELNGQVVNDLDLAEATTKVIPRSGNIGLQDWGHPVWFRNIRIKQLD